jgi:CHAD domain-containing protein
MSFVLGEASRRTERAQRAIARAARDPRAQLGIGAAAAGAAAIAARAVARHENGVTRAYRLRTGKKPASEALRVARGRIDDAVEELRDHGDDPASAVHEARKDMKKLRSLLRLARPALGSKLYRRENDRFREVGRNLSETRDAEVKLQTLSGLCDVGALAAADVAGYAEVLARERANAEASDATLATAIEDLDSARQATGEWKLGGWKPAGKGLRRAYRRGRKALAAVRAEPSDEAVHEWRKRAKDLWYHLRLLRNSHPDTLRPAADRAHELSDLLGDHHDLAVLAADASVDRRALSMPSRGKLLTAIRRRQHELLAEALPLGEELYAEKPKAFARRLASYWSAATG